jgi:hypothetical protein
MDWMNMIGGMLNQYAGGQTQVPAGQVEQHYDQAAQSVPTSVLAQGLAAAMRSDQTPAFGQLAGQLFGNSGSSQQASMLNSLLATAGPALLSRAMSGGSLPGLASILGGSAPRQLSPDEAAQVPPEEVQNLANHVQNHDPSIVDRVSEIYAQHPQVVKTLGSAALAIALGKIAQNMGQRG